MVIAEECVQAVLTIIGRGCAPPRFCKNTLALSGWRFAVRACCATRMRWSPADASVLVIARGQGQTVCMPGRSAACSCHTAFHAVADMSVRQQQRRCPVRRAGPAGCRGAAGRFFLVAVARYDAAASAAGPGRNVDFSSARAATMALSAGRKGSVRASLAWTQRRVWPSARQGVPRKAVT